MGSHFMNYAEQKPSGLACSFVRMYWRLSHARQNANAEPEPVLPDGCVELIFHFDDRFVTYETPDKGELQPRSVVAGQLSSRMLIGPSGATDIFGVRLRTEAGAALLNVSMDGLRDKIVDMRAVIGSRESELYERLSAAKTFQDKINAFERAMFRSSVREVDAGVAASVRSLRATGGSLAISRCAAELGWSTRRLERAFKEQIGLTPKTFARIVRFQSFITEAAASRLPLLDSALAAGYFDQAHLIKDFRDLAGTTPTEYFASQQQFATHFLES